MSLKESFKVRQQNELEVLQSIFGFDLEDLRIQNNKWQPLDLCIKLNPQKGSSGNQEIYSKINLHIICSAKYPKIIPKILLEEQKGLSDTLVDELLQILMSQAEELKGEVMIFELAQTVQSFLHNHNKPPSKSFYDEMVLNNQKRDQDRLNSLKQEEDQKRQQLLNEVERRKEELKYETRIRRETRRSISESSPNKIVSSSENSEIFSSGKSHLYPNGCTEHRRSETLYFHNIGRKIQKGCCLGHSQKGCVAFSGIDLETGQLLYITEWSISYEQIESKGNPSRSSDSKIHVDEIIANIEKQIYNLSSLSHKNLINYECVLCLKKKDGLIIYLVQDFILGTSVCSISGSLGWCAEGASLVAKGVLDALIYLHNNGVSHNYLYDSTVFMDNSGNIRVTDFALIPYLQDLSGANRNPKGDLAALGDLIESLSPTPHSEMRDFIEKCKSERTLSATDLAQHQFLHPVAIVDVAKTELCVLAPVTDRITTTQAIPFHTALISEHSRLQTEFEFLTYLGKGAFGDVLKVRNILDNRQYAIKRIPLPVRSKQLYKKMTREVELLSRLNHENVVRYYNSWIESSKLIDDSEHCNLPSNDWSVSSHKPSKRVQRIIQKTSGDWINCGPSSDSSSDGIEFVNSNGEIVEYDEEPSLESSDDNGSKKFSPKKEMQYMYIQMEFCEKSTLRTAIDEGLYDDKDRLWRLFREIAEGLSHIHQQGMIHRDLKPVNIFLDSRDQVKIGDFGLATTSILALQSQDLMQEQQHPEIGNSLTGKVGTALYVAPELAGNASRSTYNQKVDLYSLGIILFEMCSPSLSTAMERVKTLASLRMKEIIFPECMLKEAKYAQQITVIRWLLNHDPAARPTAEELLASDHVPPARLEAGELQEMLRHALANPQSRAYKHLISRCLAQQSDTVCEITYHLGMVPTFPLFEYVKHKVVTLFRRHGGVEVITPLLIPYCKKSNLQNNVVKLMTHSGSVVTLPHDLRVPFLRYIAYNGINYIRRYSVGRVYREKKVFDFHPKQLYECAFDIITPHRGNLLVDAELLSIAHEITHELPMLEKKNLSFRINHTSLLRSILLYCNVATDKYSELVGYVSDFIENRISKFQLTSCINNGLQPTKGNISTLIDMLLTDTSVENLNGSPLRTLIRGRGESAALAKGAIRELENVIKLAQDMGVTCPIHIYAGLTSNYDRAKSGGIVWQMTGELNISRNSFLTTIAVGGRYDSMLAEFQKSAQDNGITIPTRELSGVGFSFALDKLVYALGSDTDVINSQALDIVVCVTGSRPPLKDVTQILRSLWAAGIRSGLSEINSFDEDIMKDLGAKYIILLSEGGVLRVRSWQNDRFHEHHVPRPQLIECITKLLRSETTNNDAHVWQMSNLSLMQQPKSNNSSLPPVEFVFQTNEKLTANKKRRYESQIEQKISATIVKFIKRERIVIIVVDVPSNIVRALTTTVDPKLNEDDQLSCNSNTSELNYVIERYSKHKRYLYEIHEEICDALAEEKEPPIVGIYSITDSFYRFIL